VVEKVYQFIEQYTGIPEAVQLRLVETFFLIFFITFLKIFAARGINKWKTETVKKIQWRRSFNIVVNIIMLIILTEIWFGFFGNVGTIIGFASAGIAIALRDPLTNIAGWLYLEIRKPIKIGDRIQIGDNIGDVIDIRFLDFSMVELANWVQGDQPTGRILIIPNYKVFTLPTANYTADFPLIWNEINFEITYESNPNLALDLVNKIAKDYLQPLTKEERRKAIEYPHFQISMGAKDIYRTFVAPGKNGTQISLRFICRVYKRRQEVNDLWTKILQGISESSDIQLAYQTTRFYNKKEEGKGMFTQLNDNKENNI
jgi:small-conductance mechanosensitive channel